MALLIRCCWVASSTASPGITSMEVTGDSHGGISLKWWEVKSYWSGIRKEYELRKWKKWLNISDETKNLFPRPKTKSTLAHEASNIRGDYMADLSLEPRTPEGSGHPIKNPCSTIQTHCQGELPSPNRNLESWSHGQFQVCGGLLSFPWSSFPLECVSFS